MKKTYLKPTLEIVNVDMQLPIAISFDGDGKSGWDEVQDECDDDVIQALSRTILVTY